MIKLCVQTLIVPKYAWHICIMSYNLELLYFETIIKIHLFFHHFTPLTLAEAYIIFYAIKCIQMYAYYIIFKLISHCNGLTNVTILLFCISYIQYIIIIDYYWEINGQMDCKRPMYLLKFQGNLLLIKRLVNWKLNSANKTWTDCLNWLIQN
jgi:hypothetical protein